MTDFQFEFDQLYDRFFHTFNSASFREELKQLVEAAKREDEYWFHYLSAECYSSLSDYQNAFNEGEFCRKSIALRLLKAEDEGSLPEEKANIPALRIYLAHLLQNQAKRLNVLGRHDEAISMCDQALAYLDNPQTPYEHEQLAAGIFSKGMFLGGAELKEKAQQVFTKLICMYRDSDSINLLHTVLNAMKMRLKYLHDETQRTPLFDEAIADCTSFAARTKRDFSPFIAEFMLEQGDACPDPREAIRYLLEIINKFNGAANPALQYLITLAMLKLKMKYAELGENFSGQEFDDELFSRLNTPPTIENIRRFPQEANE